MIDPKDLTDMLGALSKVQAALDAHTVRIAAKVTQPDYKVSDCNTMTKTRHVLGAASSHVGSAVTTLRKLRDEQYAALLQHVVVPVVSIVETEEQPS